MLSERLQLSLLRWRGGATKTVVVELPVLGDYSATAPFDCSKSRRIFERGCAALARRMAQADYQLDAIPRCLNALALLASGVPEYRPLVRREAQWAAQAAAAQTAARAKAVPAAVAWLEIPRQTWASSSPDSPRSSPSGARDAERHGRIEAPNRVLHGKTDFPLASALPPCHSKPHEPMRVDHALSNELTHGRTRFSPHRYVSVLR